MPSVIGQMTRSAVFNYIVEFGGIGTATPTTATIGTDRLALTTNKAIYLVNGEGSANDDIDGISGFNEGQFLILLAATGLTHTLKDENAGAAAATDKIRLPGGTDVDFTDDEAVLLYHDDTLDRWVLLSGPSAGGGAPAAHKDSHDPNDGSDPLDSAAAAEISAVVAAGTGTAHTFSRADHIHAINHGITDNHIVTIDGTTNADEYARFTANGIVGRREAEFKADFNLEDADINTLAVAAVATADPYLKNDANDTTTGDLTVANLITAGLVDGLDCSGVEAGADVTDATNVNAAGAVMEGDTAGGDLAGTYPNPTVDAASTTAAGKVELATTAEIDTGTDPTRAMPVDQFVASDRNIRFITIRLIEAATDVTVASHGGDWRCPIPGTLLQLDSDKDWCSANVDTAGSGGGPMIVDIHKGGTTVMTTNKLQIETAEKSSTDATTQPDLTVTAVAAGDIFTFDIDSGIHTTAAKGLSVTLAIRMT